MDPLDMIQLEPRDVVVPATDGVGLAARVYEPVRPVIYDLLILPGIGVPKRVFRHVAAWFAQQGVRVLTVDYRGMGESVRDSHATVSASLSVWAERDAVGALRYVERTGGGAPVVLLGHSFGGQVLGFSDEFRRLSCVVLVGSQFGQARHWDGFARLKVSAYWRVILPVAATLCRVVPGWTGLGEPLPSGVAREWARWGRSPDWLLSSVPSAAACFAAFDRPLRAYAMVDDPIAPPRAVTDLLARFRATRPERVDLAPADFGVDKLGHYGPFRPGPTQRIWQEIHDYALAAGSSGKELPAITRAAVPALNKPSSRSREA
jgi:predicted alpha/beta hydrolase